MNSPFFQDEAVVPPFSYKTSLLRSLIEERIDGSLHLSFGQDICAFAKRSETHARALSLQAEASPPEHIPYGPTGRRIDTIKMSPAWDELAAFSASEGLIATAYKRPYSEASRILQFAKLFLFHPDSAFFSCPLAMTDGAARVLELHPSEATADAFAHLVSTDPDHFWTSGQWMTERTGGSDVSGTSTRATADGEGRYRLWGTKWFTSATTSQMALALGRMEGAPEGSKGLSLFAVTLRDEGGQLSNIEILRLKDKLGTRALPTAELELKGCPAILVGSPGQGVKTITTLVNITRLHNSACALAAAGRVIQLAFDYSQKREVFGRRLIEHPLHQETLARLAVEYEGWCHLMFELVHHLGKEEYGTATEDEKALLRLLTPVLKALTAKSCMAITSEVIEIFGGTGYVVDTGLPKWLRDAQVFSIWEGATNVLALDVLRSIAKENTFEAFERGMASHIEKLGQSSEVAALQGALTTLSGFLRRQANTPEGLQAGARDFLTAVGRCYVGALLLRRAAKTSQTRDCFMAQRWIREGLCHPSMVLSKASSSAVSEAAALLSP